MSDLTLQSFTKQERTIDLNNLVQKLIESNDFDMFKVVNINNCSDHEWYTQICLYISGYMVNASREYNINVITFSKSTKMEYSFENIVGCNITDYCFANIPECYTCDALGIKMQFSSESRSCFDKQRDNAMYLFKRNRTSKEDNTHSKTFLSNLLKTMEAKKIAKKNAEETAIVKVQNNSLHSIPLSLCKFGTIPGIDLEEACYFPFEGSFDIWGIFINNELNLYKTHPNTLFEFTVTAVTYSDKEQCYVMKCKKVICSSGNLLHCSTELTNMIILSDAIKISAHSLDGNYNVQGTFMRHLFH